jgi:hypothetical protein
MAVVVRKGIQDDEVIFAAAKNIVLRVPALGRLVTEYAARRLFA